MAVTETPPETVDAAADQDPSGARVQPTGFAAVLGSGDHKVIGRLYVAFSLLLGVVVLGLAEGFAIEGVEPETLEIFPTDAVYQAFTLTRIGTLFLLALPLVIGVAMVVVPLQVGARSIAFPRAAAASFWAWILGAGLLISSYASNGGPGGGSEVGVNLWIASMGLLVLSVLVAALCLATTVIALRAPEMTLDRTPMYAWSVMVASVLWLLTFPVLLGLLVLMYVDHRHAGATSIGNVATLFDGVAWVLRNPQIYVVAIPVLGLLADVAATASGARMKMRGVAQGAIAAFGTLSFGAFLVAPSEAAFESVIVVGMSLAAVLPLLALLVVLMDLFRRGSFSLNASLIYAVSAFLVLLLGVAAGALGAIPNLLDAPEGASSAADSIYYLGVNHAVVLAAVIGSLGGLTWWATKIGRQPAGDALAKVAPVVLLVGSVLVALGDLASGLTGEGVELSPDYSGGVPAFNGVVVAGVALVAIGLLLSLASLVPLVRKTDEDVPADPWEGQTLEWSSPSPPPLENFEGELVTVTSAEPLIDLREEK